MKSLLRCLVPALLFGFIGLAHAGNWIGAGLTLAVATPTPAAAPTPPIAASGTADPNANAAAKAELAWLQSLPGAINSQHVVQSNQDVVRTCAANGSITDDCAGIDAANYAANGNQYTGAIAVDYCNGYWGDPASPMCIFGGASDSNIQAKNWWAAGSLIQMSMHFPNPYDNWQVTAPGSATGVTCPGQGGVTTQLQGLSDDCSGINDTFIAAMLTAGTAQNASWNAELNQFATGLLDLQNSGVVVILRLFHELNASWFWWGTLTSARQAQLFQYTENYFESQGIHNALYEYCIVDSSYLSGYPGAQYVDLVATDWYGQLAGTQGPTAGYTALTQYGKPIAFAENSCGSSGGPCLTSYNFESQLQDAEASMPNLIWINFWWGENPGAANANPFWQAYMQDSWGIMRPNVPGFGR